MLKNLTLCFCISIIFTSVKYPQLLIAPCLSSLSTARSVSVRPVRAPTSGSSGGPSCRPSFWWPSVFGRWDTSRASLRQRNWCNCSPRGECKSVCVFVWVCVWCSTEWRQSLLSEETGRREKQLQDSAWKHLKIIFFLNVVIVWPALFVTKPSCVQQTIRENVTSLFITQVFFSGVTTELNSLYWIFSAPFLPCCSLRWEHDVLLAFRDVRQSCAWRKTIWFEVNKFISEIIIWILL